MKWLKIGGIVFGAVLVTALGIDAADTMQGSRSTLLGQLISNSGGVCPEGMIEIKAATSFSCVDKYEASAGEDCPHDVMNNEFDTQSNIDDSSCGSVSKEGVTPWLHVTREQAQLACARSDKRLPTNEEWQVLAAGTPDSLESCNISSKGTGKTGSYESCVSATGVFDTVGNVWEWTSNDVFDGEYNGRSLPEEGYVLQVDSGGIATLTGGAPSDLFGEDYIWSKSTGVFAIMRGGFYASKKDAGVYTMHAATLPTMRGAAIGFRCVQ